MKNKSRRCIRIAEEMHKVLSFAVLKDLSDPRTDSLMVTHIDLSPDLSAAKVFFVSASDHGQELSQEIKESYLEGLRSAKSYLRRQISEKLSLRMVPNLIFIYDDHLSRAFALDRLINACTA